METTNDDSSPKWWKTKTQNIVAFMALVFMFSFLTLLIFKDIPDKNRDIVNVLSSLLFTSLTGGVLWYLYSYKRKDVDTSDSTQTSESKTKTDDDK